MTRYLIQAVWNRSIVYSVVVDNIDSVIEEMRDGLEHGYQMYIEKEPTKE